MNIKITQAEALEIVRYHFAQKLDMDHVSVSLTKFEIEENVQEVSPEGYFKQKSIEQVMDFYSLRKIMKLPDSVNSSTYEKVAWIKVIRTLTGMSLFSAKQFVEEIWEEKEEQQRLGAEKI